MPTQMEIEPIARQLPVRQNTPMELLNVALQNNAAIDVIERLAALQERFMARDAEIEFNLAMNASQSEIQRIAPNADNTQTNTRYATYAKLDRVIRPVYLKHGFSLSFDSGESPAGTVIAYCYVSHRAGHTRKYQSPAMPLPIAGPQGKAVMTTTHGTGAAMSYAMRYLLKYIFNIAIGEEDTDGNAPSGPDMEGLDDYCTAIRDAQNFEDMDKAFRQGYSAASSIKSEKAKAALAAAREEWRKKKKAGAQ